MLDTPSISAVAAAIGVIVGFIFAILELRNLVKTRQTDLVIRLYSTFGSKEFQEAYQKVATTEYKDYNDWRKNVGVNSVEVGTFFEGIGVLLYRKLVDISLVDDLFSGPIKMTWEKMKPIAEVARKQFDYPQLYEWFEHLYNEMKKRGQTLQAQQ